MINPNIIIITPMVAVINEGIATPATGTLLGVADKGAGLVGVAVGTRVAVGTGVAVGIGVAVRVGWADIGVTVGVIETEVIVYVPPMLLTKTSCSSLKHPVTCLIMFPERMI